jgi:hypothetical protein
MKSVALGSLAGVVLLALTAPAQFEKTEKTEKKTEEVKKDFAPFVQKTTTKAEPAAKLPPLDPGIPGDVEIHFLNGSTVRMILHSDKVDVATAYGPLSVPARDIRAIDFGLHFPDGVEPRIAQAIKNLGESNFRDRDRATKELIDLGPYSFPAVSDATRSGDLEVSRRAKELLKTLQAKHPKKDLKIAIDDRVITPKFTIVGRIMTTSLKAKTELFGEVDLPVARMRTMRSMSGVGSDLDVVIDAGRYASAGQWMETDFQVDGRSAISVIATGNVDTWPQQGGQYMVTPNGLQGRAQGQHIPAVAGRKLTPPINGQLYGGMLVGKIGEDGQMFTLGERYEGTPDTAGKLYLHIVPSPWNAQSNGSYEVKIARK